MAHSLNGAVLWPPSQLLTCDGVPMDKNSVPSSGVAASVIGFPTEFPYEFDSFGYNSALESPVGSVEGSTETESSDEEDFFAGLNRRLTQKLAVPSLTQNKPEKSWVLAGSPQSTLSGIGSWSNRSMVSSNGSPNGPSQMPSPPTTPFGGPNDTWDLIYAAAGQVARLKMCDEGAKCNIQQSRGLMAPPRSVNLAKNPSTGFCSNQSFAHNLTQTNQFQTLKLDQIVKPETHSSSVSGRQAKVCWVAQQQSQQQIQNRGRSIVYENVRCGRPLGLPQSAWPPLQVHHQNQQPQPNNSGMRAVFLGGSGAKREMNGTGVFLPRRYGNNPTDSRKKSGCSTVLLPAKVVQALSLNLDDMNVHAQQPFNGGLSPELDALIARRNALLAQQKQRSFLQDGALSSETRLPKEWTY